METLPREIIGEISSYLTFQGDYLSLSETAPFLYNMLKTFPLPYLYPIRTFNIETTAIKVKGIAGRSDFMPHGDFKQFMSGRLIAFIQFKYGQRHGTYKEFYNDGRLCQESSWEEGTPHGPMKIYEKDGTLRAVANFVHGEVHGDVILYASETSVSLPPTVRLIGMHTPFAFEANYDMGVIQSYKIINDCYNPHINYIFMGNTAYRNENPSPPEKVENTYRYKNGLLDGPHILTLATTRQITHCNYRNGALHGPMRVYNSEGHLYYECNFQRDSQEGVTRIYYNNGIISDEHFFVAGKNTLRYKKFYPDGSLHQESDWLPDGQKIKVFYRNGNLRMDFETQGNSLRHKIYYPDGTLASEYNNGAKSRFNPQGRPEMDSPDASQLCHEAFSALNSACPYGTEFIPAQPNDPIVTLQNILENIIRSVRHTIEYEEDHYRTLYDSFASPREIEQRANILNNHFEIFHAE